MERVHRSKVDWWLGALLVLPVIGCAAALVEGVVKGEATTVWIGVAASAGYAFILVGLIFPMRYTVSPEGFRLRAGWLLRLDVPWERVISMHLTRNPLSSPALSIHRIHVDYRKPNGKHSYVLISPPDRPGFLRDAAAASGRHRVDGERLVAADPD